MLLLRQALVALAEAPLTAIGSVLHNEPALAGVGGETRTDGGLPVGLVSDVLREFDLDGTVDLGQRGFAPSVLLESPLDLVRPRQ